MASQLANIYNFQKPYNTYTLDQFIACQSDSSICYNNLSFIDQYNGIKFNTYNVLSDYIDEIRENYCMTIKLNKDQLFKYMYKPKLLCYDIYGNGELAFIIMEINDMCNIKEFTKDTLLMPTKDNMNLITSRIFNSDKDDIEVYNEKNKESNI